MDQVNDLLSGIEEKLGRLIEMKDQLEAEKQTLETENNELNHIIEQQKATINDLKQENRRLNTVNAIKKGQGTEEAKAKINEIVREVDKCIKLLNK
ncbi:MAG: hypothetical protein K9I94_13700 [Bacteroidales bacterium]|nr:hypothetical protein [Bacteroidales bacterium]